MMLGAFLFEQFLMTLFLTTLGCSLPAPTFFEQFVDLELKNVQMPAAHFKSMRSSAVTCSC